MVNFDNLKNLFLLQRNMPDSFCKYKGIVENEEGGMDIIMDKMPGGSL